MVRGERSRRRGVSALSRNHIGLAVFSAGSTLGLRAPDCAKESSTLWTLLTLRRGCVGANTQRLCGFAQSHWLCNAFRGEYVGAARPKPAPKSLRLSGLSSRCGWVGLVQIRYACTLLRSHIGLAVLSAGSTLGLRAPDCAKESSTLWTLFTLRRGYAGACSRPYKKRQRPNHRTHACKTRVHGKTRPALIYGRAGRAV